MTKFLTREKINEKSKLKVKGLTYAETLMKPNLR